MFRKLKLENQKLFAIMNESEPIQPNYYGLKEKDKKVKIKARG